MIAPPERQRLVRDRVRRLIEALESEDLEERVAPVKCSKHPDAPECIPPYGLDYGVPAYAVPGEGRGE